MELSSCYYVTVIFLASTSIRIFSVSRLSVKWYASLAVIQKECKLCIPNREECNGNQFHSIFKEDMALIYIFEEQIVNNLDRLWNMNYIPQHAFYQSRKFHYRQHLKKVYRCMFWPNMLATI